MGKTSSKGDMPLSLHVFTRNYKCFEWNGDQQKRNEKMMEFTPLRRKIPTQDSPTHAKNKKSTHKLTNDVFKVNIAPTKQHTTDQDELENSSETFFSK